MIKQLATGSQKTLKMMMNLVNQDFSIVQQLKIVNRIITEKNASAMDHQEIYKLKIVQWDGLCVNLLPNVFQIRSRENAQ